MKLHIVMPLYFSPSQLLHLLSFGIEATVANKTVLG